jgi:hypothetical protein
MGDENKESTKDFWRFPKYMKRERETVHLFLSNQNQETDPLNMQ